MVQPDQKLIEMLKLSIVPIPHLVLLEFDMPPAEEACAALDGSNPGTLVASQCRVIRPFFWKDHMFWAIPIW